MRAIDTVPTNTHKLLIAITSLVLIGVNLTVVQAGGGGGDSGGGSSGTDGFGADVGVGSCGDGDVGADADCGCGDSPEGGGEASITANANAYCRVNFSVGTSTVGTEVDVAFEAGKTSPSTDWANYTLSKCDSAGANCQTLAADTITLPQVVEFSCAGDCDPIPAAPPYVNIVPAQSSALAIGSYTYSAAMNYSIGCPGEGCDTGSITCENDLHIVSTSTTPVTPPSTPVTTTPSCSLSTAPAYPQVGEAYTVDVAVANDPDGPMWLWGCPQDASLPGGCLYGWGSIPGTFSGGTGSYSHGGIPDTNPRYFQVHINANSNPAAADFAVCNLTVVAGQTAPTSTPTGSTNGQCGPAAKTYTHSETWPAGVACSAGTDSGASDPAPGGSSSWQCLGSSGGVDESCTATRSDPPPTAEIEVRNVTQGGSFTPYGLTGTSALMPGDEIELKWGSTNATGCVGASFTTGTTAPPSGMTGSLPGPSAGTSRTYTVICSGTGGSVGDSLSVETRSLSPTIDATPAIIRIDGNPTPDDVTVIWDTVGNDPTLCSLTGPGMSGIDLSLRPASSEAINLENTAAFTLDCGPGGSASTTVQVLPRMYET